MSLYAYDTGNLVHRVTGTTTGHLNVNVADALPAGTNGIGSLTAGTAAIGSLTAGTAAIGTVGVTVVDTGYAPSNLGKKTGNGNTSQDIGVTAMGVIVDDAAAALTLSALSYSQLRMNRVGSMLTANDTYSQPLISSSTWLTGPSHTHSNTFDARYCKNISIFGYSDNVNFTLHVEASVDGTNWVNISDYGITMPTGCNAIPALVDPHGGFYQTFTCPARYLRVDIAGIADVTGFFGYISGK